MGNTEDYDFLFREINGKAVLLLEDDTLFADDLIAAVTKCGAAVDWVANGFEALGALKVKSYDLVILDREVPGLNGLEVLKAYKTGQPGATTAPVLILTSLGSLSSRMEGFEAGADDYIVKGGDELELLARIAAKIRRARTDQAQAEAGLWRNGPLVVEELSRSVRYDGEDIPMEAGREKGFDVLCALIKVCGTPLTMSMLHRQCWPNFNVLPDGFEGSVYKAMSLLRRDLEVLESRLSKPIIINVRSQGYMMRQL